MPDAPFIHEHALVETDSIGPGTRIWAFAHVMPGAVIGMERFGESAPAPDLFAHFGFTSQRVADAARSVIAATTAG